MKFWYCEKCKNLFQVLNDGGITPVCCNQDMILLEANTEDASNEKHVPFITRDGANVTVQVGSEAHPMLDAHYIEWIIVQQGDHIQAMMLHPDEEPKATFVLQDADAPIKVYEHCNLHGLWLAEA